MSDYEGGDANTSVYQSGKTRQIKCILANFFKLIDWDEIRAFLAYKLQMENNHVVKSSYDNYILQALGTLYYVYAGML